jgi:catechol 2,3-dioxygenase-like lactoylglutathione lyase family enzyme
MNDAPAKAATTQTRIPCVMMRGGTSRGPYFLASDLPSDPATRDAVLLVPRATPVPVKEVLTAAMPAALADPLLVQRLREEGAEPSTLGHRLRRTDPRRAHALGRGDPQGQHHGGLTRPLPEPPAPPGGVARVPASWTTSGRLTMRLSGLDHVNVRCAAATLPAMIAFWSDVLGLRQGPRPSFTFPGAWLYLGDSPVVHLSGRGTDEAHGNERATPVDHVAFRAHDIAAARERLRQAGISWREQEVPGRALKQIFVTDPAGTRVELLFDMAQDSAAAA